MAITVRLLAAADAAPLAPLFGAYLDFYRVARNPPAEAAFLEARLSATDSTALGALLDGQLCGFALCHHAYNSLRLAPAWILHDLFVDPARRRHGAGKALIEAVHARAEAQGACEVVLSTAHDNTTARKLYEKEGYRLDTAFRVYVRDLRP